VSTIYPGHLHGRVDSRLPRSAVGGGQAVQTGPFPLNIAVGAAIAALFGADTFKKIRMWRSMPLSRR